MKGGGGIGLGGRGLGGGGPEEETMQRSSCVYSDGRGHAKGTQVTYCRGEVTHGSRVSLLLEFRFVKIIWK